MTTDLAEFLRNQTLMAAIDPPVCADCGTPIDEPMITSVADRKSCAICGSLARRLSVRIHESVTIKEKLKMKQKRDGYKRPIFESVSGDNLHHKTGRWNKLTRSIDRENNHYREEIVDPETGKIIRLCNEPLTEHRNRGSARMKKRI